MLHIYTVEILYAAVFDGYVDWHKATVETVFRASLSDDQAVHFHGHERVRERSPACTSRTRIARAGTGPAHGATSRCSRLGLASVLGRSYACPGRAHEPLAQLEAVADLGLRPAAAASEQGSWPVAPLLS